MRKIITTLLVATTLATVTPNPVAEAKGKVILVEQDKVTPNFLKAHKADTIYFYIQGKRVKANGDGKDTDGYYIKYCKGKVGTKFTSIFRYRKGATEMDDFNERVDYKGWSKPKKG